jgi:hypothetical protein
MRESAIDGFCDDSTEAATLVFKYVGMSSQIVPDSVLDDRMVTAMTAIINTYKEKYIYSDSQMDVAKLYLQNHSRGNRLAKECITAVEKYEKALAEKEEANRKELEKFYEEERKAREEAENSSSEQNDIQG